MTCYLPNKAFLTNNGVVFSRAMSNGGELIHLPCGKCDGCKLDRSRNWAIRCMHEASLYLKNIFVTFTYNDDKLPANRSLDRDHFPLFMKRLRKMYGEGIRYYHCGEYGEKTDRPHYHALIFNHDFPDKVLHGERNGRKVYTSKILDGLWTHGHCLIGDVTFESAAYVARYVMKKNLSPGHTDVKVVNGRVPEYSTMSRRPGIGYNWYKKYMTDVFPSDEVIVNGKSVKPPRYYSNLYKLDDPFGHIAITETRKESGSRGVPFVRKGRTVIVSKASRALLDVKAGVKREKLKLLNRPLGGS